MGKKRTNRNTEEARGITIQKKEQKMKMKKGVHKGRQSTSTEREKQ